MAPLPKQSQPFTSKGLGTNGYVDTFVASVDSNVASGSLLFLAINMGGGGAVVTQVTDNRGNTWSRWDAACVDNLNDGDPESNQRTEVWTAISNGAGALTITMKCDTLHPVAWTPIFMEWTGLTSTPQGAAGTSSDSTYFEGH